MKTLYPYQRKGVEYAVTRIRKGKNILLADEMGLGKTVQAIVTMNELYPATKASVIVICPVSLKINWLNELNYWHTSLATVTVAPMSQLDKVDVSADWRPTGNWPFDLCIIDEAHLFKNPNTLRSTNLRRITDRSKRIMALTGTPADNRPKEMFGLLCLLDPKRWNAPVEQNNAFAALPKELFSIGPVEGAKKKKGKYTPQQLRFYKRYCGAVLKGTGKWEMREGERREVKVWEFSGGSNLEELNDILLRSIMIRRLKKDVLKELPPKRRQIIELPSSVSDNRFLSTLTSENYDASIRALYANPVQFREFSEVRRRQGLSKVPHVTEAVTRALLETEKVVIMAHHTDVILQLAKALMPLFGTVVLVGDTPVSERQDVVDIFQDDPNCRVFIGSIGAAGVGITLTSASVIFFAELDPNPAKMTQGEDRLHRIGQKDMVLVYHVVSNGSIDARIAKILVEKQENLDKMLGGSRYDSR